MAQGVTDQKIISLTSKNEEQDAALLKASQNLTDKIDGVQKNLEKDARFPALDTRVDASDAAAAAADAKAVAAHAAIPAARNEKAEWTWIQNDYDKSMVAKLGKWVCNGTRTVLIDVRTSNQRERERERARVRTRERGRE
jgi:hypothetical protein